MNFSQILDNPLVWEFSRRIGDLCFGLYRKRFQQLHQWGFFGKELSILEIGCGIGQYASITRGPYLGLDLNCRYIDYARKRNRLENQTFRCVDVTTVWHEKAKYNLVLMVDFLHHIPDEYCVKLLNITADLAQQYTVIFEPVTFQPHWIGDWLVKHDRGRYVRSLDELHQLIGKSSLAIVESSELWFGPINSRAILARRSN